MCNQGHALHIETVLLKEEGSPHRRNYVTIDSAPHIALHSGCVPGSVRSTWSGGKVSTLESMFTVVDLGQGRSTVENCIDWPNNRNFLQHFDACTCARTPKHMSVQRHLKGRVVSLAVFKCFQQQRWLDLGLRIQMFSNVFRCFLTVTMTWPWLECWGYKLSTMTPTAPPIGWSRLSTHPPVKDVCGRVDKIGSKKIMTLREMLITDLMF